MTVLAHFSVTAYPADGTSVGRYVRRAVEVLRASGLKFEVHAMGTEIEAPDLARLQAAIQEVHDALLRMGAKRVSFQLKVDDRRDHPTSLAAKVASATRRDA